jgi:hypothetical protein
MTSFSPDAMASTGTEPVSNYNTRIQAYIVNQLVQTQCHSLLQKARHAVTGLTYIQGAVMGAAHVYVPDKKLPVMGQNGDTWYTPQSCADQRNLALAINSTDTCNNTMHAFSSFVPRDMFPVMKFCDLVHLSKLPVETQSHKNTSDRSRPIGMVYEPNIPVSVAGSHAAATRFGVLYAWFNALKQWTEQPSTVCVRIVRTACGSGRAWQAEQDQREVQILRDLFTRIAEKSGKIVSFGVTFCSRQKAFSAQAFDRVNQAGGLYIIVDRDLYARGADGKRLVPCGTVDTLVRSRKTPVYHALVANMSPYSTLQPMKADDCLNEAQNNRTVYPTTFVAWGELIMLACAHSRGTAVMDIVPPRPGSCRFLDMTRYDSAFRVRNVLRHRFGLLKHTNVIRTEWIPPDSISVGAHTKNAVAVTTETRRVFDCTDRAEFLPTPRALAASGYGPESNGVSTPVSAPKYFVLSQDTMMTLHILMQLCPTETPSSLVAIAQMVVKTPTEPDKKKTLVSDTSLEYLSGMCLSGYARARLLQHEEGTKLPPDVQANRVEYAKHPEFGKCGQCSSEFSCATCRISDPKKTQVALRSRVSSLTCVAQVALVQWATQIVLQNDSAGVTQKRLQQNELADPTTNEDLTIQSISVDHVVIPLVLTVWNISLQQLEHLRCISHPLFIIPHACTRSEQQVEYVLVYTRRWTPTQIENWFTRSSAAWSGIKAETQRELEVQYLLDPLW